MIDLKNIKLVFVDYDDTLCIHRHVDIEPPSHEDWVKAQVNGDIMQYISSQFDYSPAVKFYINTLFKQGAELYVLTWDNINALYMARKKFLSLYYGKDTFKDVIITNQRYTKVDIAKDYARIKGITPDKVLMIDDHPDTRFEFKQAGFSTVSVSELSMMYEQRLLELITSTYKVG